MILTRSIYCAALLVGAVFCSLSDHHQSVDESVADLQKLSDLVQRRLQHIQSPKNCSSARKVVCKFNGSCGYGCQVHHIALCLIIAYATERTLVLDNLILDKSKGIYGDTVWEDIFLPLSETCTSQDGATHGNYPASDDVQVLHMPKISAILPTPKYLPLAFPADLAPQLKALHPDPSVWWVSQFVKFVMRYQPKTKAMIDQEMNRLNFTTNPPTVGIHVRRTDKYQEAALRDLSEYMEEVKSYFKKQGNGSTKPRIFLASDEPKVIEEAKNVYTEYEFVFNEKAASMAALSLRNSKKSLDGAIVDVHLLSVVDFLVCTLSSNVARLAYDLGFSGSLDKVLSFKSLDRDYNYHSRIGRTIVEMPTYPEVPRSPDMI